MNARREPVPRALEHIPEHVFAPNPYGPRDWDGKQLECLFRTSAGRWCKFPKANAVHRTSQELAEALPPTHPDDRSDAIIGERRPVPDPPSRES